MKSPIAIVIVIAACLWSPAARADKWILGADMGAVFTPEKDDRVDAAALFGLVVGRGFTLSSELELTVQLDIPMPPGFSVQVPITLRWWPTETGLTLQAAARPMASMAGVCANDTDQCPGDEALEPRDRGGFVVGLLGGVGIGYARGYYFGDVAYLGGYLRGIDRDDGGEEPRTGLYHGIMFSFGARL